MSHSWSLDDWLTHMESIHHQPIALGLERVLEVRQALGGSQPFVVVAVAGTNGKGSTCAMLDCILRAAGYRVGVYASPHLLRYNERVRVAGQAVDDAALCAAFAKVEAARGNTPLTYFEFGTLAAWLVFEQACVDVAILEVGMGGRLDAVNAFNADCGIVTSVDLDHQAFLGNDREQIGYEKAGIFRTGKPAIVSDPAPPRSVVEYALKIGAQLLVSGQDFGFTGDRSQWHYWNRKGRRPAMAYPALRGANQLLNASGALAALDCLKERLPVSMQDIRLGLMLVELPGRFQVLPGRPAIVLDVAHNPHAAAVLADNLSNMGFFPETYAVLGMLGDKDVDGVVRAVQSRVDHWLLTDLDGPRAASAAQLAQALERTGAGGDVSLFASAEAALAAAKDRAGESDRIVVFGSFLTVAGAMRAEGLVPHLQ